MDSIRILTAVVFSLVYVSLYPVLLGGGTIYHYPAWSPPLAAVYVLVGILLQAGFCFGRRRKPAGGRLLAQIVTGVLYAVVALEGIYQS